MLIGESTVFGYADKLSPLDYGGGSWVFYEQDGKPLFMAPDDEKRFRISVEGNMYEGTVSAQAAGIIFTMFALSDLSFRYNSDHLSDAYARLYEFALNHAEASAIFAATD